MSAVVLVNILDHSKSVIS